MIENWDLACKAVERYGSLVAAIPALQNEIESYDSDSSYFSGVGNSVDSSKDRENANKAGANRDHEVSQIVARMASRSQQWHNTKDEDEIAKLNRDQAEDAQKLDSKYGVKAELRDDGWWYIVSDSKRKWPANTKLYSAYLGVYHTGGIAGQEQAGAHPNLKSNEIFAKLEKGEVVISNKQKDNLFRMIDMAGNLSKKMATSQKRTGFSSFIYGNLAETISNAIPGNITTTNNSPSISIGDVIIQGVANDATVAKHREVTRQFANQIFDFLGVKK